MLKRVSPLRPLLLCACCPPSLVAVSCRPLVSGLMVTSQTCQNTLEVVVRSVTQSVVTVWNLTQACALRTRKGRVLHKPADDKVTWKKASRSGRGRRQQVGHHDFDNSRRRRAISCARSSTSSKCTKNVVNAKRLSKEAFSFQGWLWWSRLSRCSKSGVAVLLTANRDHGRFVHVLWTALRHPAIHHRRWGKRWLKDT